MYYHANIFLRIFLRYRTCVGKVYQKFFIIVLSSRAVMLSVTTPGVSLFSLVDQNKHSDGDRCCCVDGRFDYDNISFQRFSQTRKGVFRPLFTSTFRGIFPVIFFTIFLVENGIHHASRKILNGRRRGHFFTALYLQMTIVIVLA